MLQEGSATNVENGEIGFFEIDDQPLSGMGGGMLFCRTQTNSFIKNELKK